MTEMPAVTRRTGVDDQSRVLLPLAQLLGGRVAWEGTFRYTEARPADKTARRRRGGGGHLPKKGLDGRLPPPTSLLERTRYQLVSSVLQALHL